MHEDDQTLHAELNDRLHAMGLGRVAGAVLRLARPSIRLSLTRAVDEADIPIGASKVGGSADLAADVAWPTWDGVPLPFIAQVQLEEVAALDPEGDLPHHGLLSFFYTPNHHDGSFRVEDDPNAWRVLYTEDTARAERRPLPDALTEGFATSFPACAVVPSRRLTLPADEGSAGIKSLGMTNDERLAYIDLVVGSSAGFETEMDHRLLGHPYQLNSYPFLDGYLARNGIERPVPPHNPLEDERRVRALADLQEAAKEWREPEGGYQSPADFWRTLADFRRRVDPEALRRAVRDLQPAPEIPDFRARMDELRRASEAEWRLLLQVYSNEDAEMDWAGGGVVHFVVDRRHLAARNFSSVWVNLDFL
jgi:uncharacterized protein YwqG